MNKVHAIKYLYPDARQGTDFDVYAEDGVQYIAFWNLAEPEPTDAELQQAHDEMPPYKPEKSHLEQLQETVDQLVLDDLLGG